MSFLVVNILDEVKTWFSYIPKLIYFICVSFMSLLDAIQLVLRKLAGLDGYNENGVQKTGDVALGFIQSVFDKNSSYPAIKNAFWALVIFSVLLLLLSTIVAVIRNEYMPGSAEAGEKPSNTKSHIIKRAFKSVFLFLIVPVSCIFGLMISDLTLSTIDRITTSSTTTTVAKFDNNLLVSNETYEGSGVYTYTNYDMFGISSPTSTMPFSSVMFKTAAYNANRVRINQTYSYDKTEKTYYEFLSEPNGSITNFGLFNQGESLEECADLIDEAFANCVILQTSSTVNLDGPMKEAGKGIFSLDSDDEITKFSKFNVGLVYYYYDLWQFNYILGFMFLIISGKILVNIVFGLMKRIIEVVALFVISPPIIAIMPLDEGKMFDGWRKNFISKALMAFGAIIGMNVLFLILPHLLDIDFFGTGGKGIEILNLILNSLFVVVGLSSVNDFIKLFSGLVGGENADEIGGKTAEATGANLAKSAKMVGASAGLATALPRNVAKYSAVGAYKAHQHMNAKRFENNKDKIYRNSAKRSDVKTAMANAENAWENEHGKLADSYSSYENEINAKRNELANKYADERYDEYVKNFIENNSYKDKKHAGQLKKPYLSRDAWNERNTDKINAAMKKAENEVSKMTENEFKDLQKKHKEFVNQTAREEITKVGKERYDKSVATRKKIVGAIANKTKEGASVAMDTMGVNNAIALGTLYADEIKGMFVRGGKGGFNSMKMAFQGKSASEIEAVELAKKLEKEEKTRQRIQNEFQEKIDKEEREREKRERELEAKIDKKQDKGKK